MMRELFARDSRTKEQKRDWVRRFESPGNRRAILGTNEWAATIADLLDIEYFIDDFSALNEFRGKPVVRRHDADREVMTLTTNVGRPLTAREVVRNCAKSHLDYYSYLQHTKLPVRRIEYLSDDVYLTEWVQDALRRLRETLFDDVSVETLDRVIRLRRDLELDSMVVFTDRQSEQYFEPFLKMKDDSTFLDVGAFDGYTTEMALQKYGQRLKCHLFEPGKAMVGRLRERFSHLTSVTIHPYGLADRRQLMSFDEHGSASKIGVGDSVVEVETLDSFGLNEVDLIKVDIEGAEESFLEGATATILQCQPQIAIACYHANAQIPNLFTKLTELMPEARVYLRHYTEGFAETDLFFVPKRFW